MDEVNKWFRCSNRKPKKRGVYLLLIGFRSRVGSWLEEYIIESKWNGKAWDIPEGFVCVSWKYRTPADTHIIKKLEQIKGDFTL